MRFCALATDVDGTLTTRSEGISLDAIGAIRGLERRGVRVVLASARPFCVLNILREYIGCSGAVICENGGVVEYRGDMRVLGDRAQGLEALRALKEAFGGGVVEGWTNPHNAVDVVIERSMPREEVVKVLGGFPSLKLLDSGFYYHVLPADVGKGRGLRVAAEMMGLSTRSFVAIGDSEVDVDLLAEAGFGVAVTDSEELAPVADMVTKRKNGEGFCEAVRRLFPELKGMSVEAP